MEKKELICIGCPLGCAITVEMEGTKIKRITGNTCPRGKTYAEREVINPMRTVTSTVKVTGGEKEIVSVKTRTEIPKGKIFDVMHELKDIVVMAPVNIGDILAENVAGTGTEIVATANVAAKLRVQMTEAYCEQ